MSFTSLPHDMIENILSYLSYDEVAKNRLVCRAFNEISMRILNRGFVMIEKRHNQALKGVKAQLPRRESERRNEALEAASIARLAVLQKLEAIDRALQHTWHDNPRNIEHRQRLAILIDEFDNSPASYGKNQEAQSNDPAVMALQALQQVQKVFLEILFDWYDSSKTIGQRNNIGKAIIRLVGSYEPIRYSEYLDVVAGSFQEYFISAIISKVPAMFPNISKTILLCKNTRYHHLSRHCDILTSIETRISMLNMTYSKFIDLGYCCFIPGKVIDEIKRVLHLVETSATPPRAHEVLQELRDISSMAIEHFDDKICPAFRQKMNMMVMPQPARAPTAGPPLGIRQDLIILRKRCMLTTKISQCLAKQYKKSCKQMLGYKKIALYQQKAIRNLTKKQREQDAAIADLKKRIEECDIKYSELTHTNQAAGGKAKAATSAGEVVLASTAAQPLRHFSSQIKLDLSVMPIGTNKRNNKTKLPNMKPRKSIIKLPSLSEDSGPPAKVQKIDESPSPSTSQERQSPRTRSQCVTAKITGITNELRQLSNISNAYDSKRKIGMHGCNLNVPDSKKKKSN